MIRKMRWAFCILLLASISGSLAAQTDAMGAPDDMMKAVTRQVLQQIKSDKAIQAGDMARVTALVNSAILPYVDFTRTTRLAMGRNWSSASEPQRQALIDQFRQLLIHTYAGALSQVRDQEITYQPLRALPADNDVVVRSTVASNGSAVELDYRLYKTPQGWRVYDINILGAWLIQVYQQQFAEQVAQHGVDGLLTFLTKRNEQLASGQ